jgi:pyruvate,water dikinase
VPNGFMVAAEIFDRVAKLQSGHGVAWPPEIVGQIQRACEKLKAERVAVRSSGLSEDLAEASFAGQFQTVLNVRGVKAVLRAIETCWASAMAPRVAAYREARAKNAASRIAVLIQHQLDPAASGVAFSANPITGQRDEVVINAVKGMGDKLVSGEAGAEVWIVRDESAFPEAGEPKVLTPRQAVMIARLAKRAEAALDAPQDIEWALERDELHLLQSRPITALPDPVNWTPPHPGLWLRTFRIGEWLGDPVTPLFETWLLHQLEQRLFAHFARIVPSVAQGPYHVVVNGWYFTTVNFLPRNVLNGLGLGLTRLLPALARDPSAFSLLSTRFAHVAMVRFEAEWRSGPKQRYEAAVQSAHERVMHLDREELVRLVDELAALAGDELFYFFAVGGGVWKVERSLARFLHKHRLVDGDASFQDLLVGLSKPSPEHPHAALSLDWFQPTIGELLGSPRGNEPSVRQQDAVRVREAATQRLRAQLANSPAKTRVFERLLTRAQHFGRVREEQAVHLTLAWPVMRKALDRLGAQLVREGLLDETPDLYFLTRDEATDLPTPRSDLRQRVAERKELWRRQRRLTPPAFVGEMSPLRQRILLGLEQNGRNTTKGDPRNLPGVAASPGRASGRVRVILSPDEFGRFMPGEVLVTAATSPGWTPLFRHAAAVVTDTGSAMAHASLVAREFGIPAVVGVGDATRRLRDGQLVTVDGSRGLVRVDDEAMPSAPSVGSAAHGGMQ